MKFEVRGTDLELNIMWVTRIECGEYAIDAEIEAFFAERLDMNYEDLDFEDGYVINYEDGKKLVEINSITELDDNTDTDIISYLNFIHEDMGLESLESGKYYEIKKIDGDQITIAETNQIDTYKKVNGRLEWIDYKFVPVKEITVNMEDLKGYTFG